MIKEILGIVAVTLTMCAIMQVVGPDVWWLGFYTGAVVGLSLRLDDHLDRRV